MIQINKYTDFNLKEFVDIRKKGLNKLKEEKKEYSNKLEEYKLEVNNVDLNEEEE